MPTVPDAVLDKLRCISCKKWLSYGPIRLLPNGGSICGRCIYVGPKNQYRHFAFEALACYFQFPCKYWENYCGELIPFKKVTDHEQKCNYGSKCSVLCSRPSVLCKSTRRLDVNSAIKLIVTPEEVLEYLRCSSCAGYLSSPPVFVCRDGTSICHRCSSQIPQPNGEFIRDICFEVFVDIMIFPCIFRYRGCTETYKFGTEMMEHEVDCPYGQTYSREQRRPTEPLEKTHKEKGVIKTISGHIYATITPNAPLFSPVAGVSNQNQEMFLDEFPKHRYNLATKWGQTAYAQQYLQDDRDTISNHSQPLSLEPRYSNPMMNSHLIDELKVRQKIRDSFRGQNGNSNAYYTSQQEPQRMDYSVYPTNS